KDARIFRDFGLNPFLIYLRVILDRNELWLYIFFHASLQETPYPIPSKQRVNGILKIAASHIWLSRPAVRSRVCPRVGFNDLSGPSRNGKSHSRSQSPYRMTDQNCSGIL